MPTDAFTRETLKQRTNEGIHTLITITHADLPAPIRITDHPGGDVIGPGGATWVTRDGVVARFPQDFAEGEPTGSLSMSNILRDLIDAIRSTSSTPDVQVDIVAISDPTTVQHGPFLYQIGRARYDELNTEFELILDDLMDDAFPGYRFDPKNTPGAF